MKRIPFVEEMRDAIAAGRKVETRRLVLPGKPCPYRVGEVLGVGEPHRLWVVERSSPVDVPGFGAVEFSVVSQLVCAYEDGARRATVLSEAQEARQRALVTVGLRTASGQGRPARCRSSRFLPDAFVRLRIRVLAVHQEPLQAITPAGARREGAPELSGLPAFHAHGTLAYVHWFRALWDDLHRAPGERWRDDPPVHVIRFETVADEPHTCA